MAIGLAGCATATHQKTPQPEQPVASAKPATMAAAEPEPGEVKVKLDDTPPAVRATIDKELVDGELEDISRKQRDGKTVYETDIIKDGGKWEVVVAEDGSIASKLREGSAEEQAADRIDKAELRVRSDDAAAGGADDAWRQGFDVNKANLKPTGKNSCLPIQPGKLLKLRNPDGDTLTITILNDTKVVDGVTCGILEERETKNGKLIEVSRNYFATDPATQDVYYFGEDVDNYKDGKIVNHESAWLAGEHGARFGLMLPGKPKVGEKFYQEIAPKVAMDRVEVVSIDETVKTPAGTFDHCVHLKETTPIEPDVSHKYYCPGVGMIKDDDFELVERP
jgi:hypothetical protein